ncbi:MAG TPA: sulfotransferase [Xanthobacteraceae bacterium]|jgi:tetratricopeptide (TPR) repeat protein
MNQRARQGETARPAIGEALRHADRSRREGRLIEAEAICRKILQVRTDLPEAEHLLGIIAHQGGKLGEALAHVQRAIQLAPQVALFHANLGEMCRLAGRLDEALAAGRRALVLKPEYPVALNTVGLVLFAQGKFEEALAHYDRAIALQQDFVKAYFNRGNALLHLQRLTEAVAAYRCAIALKPDLADAWGNLGSCLRDLKRPKEAEAAYRKALELAPNNPDTLNLMGLLVYERGALEAALALYRRALALKPDHAGAHNNLGNLLKALGQLRDAEEAYLKALQSDPNSACIYFNLADSKTFKPGDPHLAAMEALAAKSESLPTTERIQLDFALGKAYADLNDYPRSFRHLFAGNAAKRATINYNEKAVFDLIDLIESVFTSDLIKTKSGGGEQSKTPIFIVGMPRSGTTLIEQIIASHPLVHGAGELPTFHQIVRTRRGPDGDIVPYPNYVPAVDDAALTAIGAYYVALARKLASAASAASSTNRESSKATAEYVTDKMPSNYYFAGLIHLALPNAKIIHSIRDPIDTCVSCFSKLFPSPLHQTCTYDLGELGRYYRRYERLMGHWRRVLPPGCILDVRYEDVVTDLEAQARRIIAYCGLPWNDDCVAFHKIDRPVHTASATQVRQPIYKNAIGRWRVYKNHLGPLLDALSEQ